MISSLSTILLLPDMIYSSGQWFPKRWSRLLSPSWSFQLLHYEMLQDLLWWRYYDTTHAVSLHPTSTVSNPPFWTPWSSTTYTGAFPNCSNGYNTQSFAHSNDSLARRICILLPFASSIVITRPHYCSLHLQDLVINFHCCPFTATHRLSS